MSGVEAKKTKEVEAKKSTKMKITGRKETRKEWKGKQKLFLKIVHI